MTAKLILNFNNSDEFIPFLKLLKDLGLDKNLAVSKKFKKNNQTELKPRQAGWGKGLFTHLAPDFDEIPAGFEDYILINNRSK